MSKKQNKTLPELDWPTVVENITPLVFRLASGQSGGTAFVIGFGANQERTEYRTMFSTAWHVVEEQTHQDDEITLVSYDKKTSFKSSDTPMRLVGFDPKAFDTALIEVASRHPIVNESQLAPIPDIDWILPRGAEIGWMGFPGLLDSELCFFHGHLSGYASNPHVYLVDGVAINGVSGGPAFDKKGQLMGLVSSYIPNRINKTTTLPGLLTLVPITIIRHYMENVVGATVKQR